MAYTYNEDGTSSSTFNKNRGHNAPPGSVGGRPTINTAVGGIIQKTGQLATIGGIAYLGLKAINSVNEQ